MLSIVWTYKPVMFKQNLCVLYQFIMNKYVYTKPVTFYLAQADFHIIRGPVFSERHDCVR
jgi:hypothetical protein